jgi:hypothetical protein
MTEADSDFFFGRTRETVEIIQALEAKPDKLPILLGNSGVGKSSVAQAGVIAALARQGWPDDAAEPGPWPPAFANSRQWCFLTLRPGAEPVKSLVDSFIRTWRYDATDPAWEERRSGWIERLLAGKATLPGLLDATERRHEELGQPKPPAFFLYLDQGEELYVRAEERQGRRFSEVLAQGAGDPRLRTMMSMRTDFFGHLQKDESLYEAHQHINVPPLREAQLHEVVSKPAELLGARLEYKTLGGDIARRAADESTKDAGAAAMPGAKHTLNPAYMDAAFSPGTTPAYIANYYPAPLPAGMKLHTAASAGVGGAFMRPRPSPSGLPSRNVGTRRRSNLTSTKSPLRRLSALPDLHSAPTPRPAQIRTRVMDA